MKPTEEPILSAGLETIFERMATPVWIYDIDHSGMVWANAAGCRMWRAESVDELRARDFKSDMSVAVATKLQQYKIDFEKADATFSEIWTHYPLGKPSTMRITYRGIRLEDGRMAMLCEGGGDFKETPDKLRSAEALVHTSVMITLSDQDGNLLYRNPAATAADPDLGTSLADRFVDKADYRTLQTRLLADGQAHVVAEMQTKAGARWHEITARHCVDPVTGIPVCLSSEVDVTELKTTEEQARHAACHDPLTNLPNRIFVQTVFEQRLKDMLAAGSRAALLFIDLDRFKTINDSLGHSKGDLVLLEVARRLSAAIGDDGVIARLGGDEFLVLIEIAEDEAQMRRSVDRVLETIQVPVILGEHQLRLSSSIGISISPADGLDITTLMKNADAAMYEAKKDGRNRSTFYIPAFGQNALTRMNLEIDLQRDFDDRVLQLYYQPRIAVKTGRIVSAEVLLRWPHARSGFIPPDAFIPLAEDTGLIVQIGAWILRKAARQQVIWKTMGFPIGISVNLSPRQFSDGNIVLSAREALADAGADASDFEFEITERLLLGEEQHVSEKLRDLKEMGFAISIDDFGTGYSNLAQLQRHPIDCLKIDRSFVSNLVDQSPILEMIIRMCQLLNVKIVAEGVETPAQRDWLASRNCDEYQGFLFSRPVPAEDFERMLAADAAQPAPAACGADEPRVAQLVA